ncbi:uncharacterized protein LOC123295433 [Chrysoperla carnea]|uniref:uncharacterized protein LOC123295433 n=1 Tax=Chrysoperla carnea TaxID=189513 RepID=UPI001D064AED|nr:uncharacterized protein LOC123295433 [Chrysoperla carnea]
MYEANLLWFNWSKISIIIILIVINLTLNQCQLNGTVIEAENVTYSLLLNNEINNNSSILKINLMDPDELKIKKYSSVMENDRTQILNQLDSITEIINSILDMINGNETSVPPQAPSSRPKCNVTKEKLERVQKEIKSMISNITDINEGDSKCTLNFDNTDNCNNLVKTILCGLNHVKKGFHDALLDGGSDQQVTKWKNAFDALTKKFEQEKDDLIQSLSHKHQLELDKLQKEIHNLRKQLITKEENIIELCVVQIAVGQTQKAVDHFLELSTTPASIIVKKAYHFNDYTNPDELERLANIDQFILLLPQIEMQRDALKTFFNEMKVNTHLKTIRVLIINHTYKNSLLSRNEIPDEINKNTDLILSEFFEALAYNKNDSKFNQFIRLSLGRYFNMYSFNLLNRVLNNKALNETIRIKNILDSIRRFPCDHAAEGLLYVNYYMISNNLIYDNTNALKLAYYVNYFNKICNTENTKIKLKNIRKKLPEHVVGFIDHISHHRCRLKNSAHNYYLMGGNVMDNKVLIGSLKQPAKLTESLWWEFETSNNCESFTIKQSDYYLSPIKNDKSNKPRRPVRTYNTVEQSSWEIIPRKGGSYSIKNIHFNEYLFADSVMSFFENGDNVYTWKNELPTNGWLWDVSLWEPECADN